MQHGRLRNLRAEPADRIADLRAKREPTVDVKLITAAVSTPVQPSRAPTRRIRPARAAAAALRAAGKQAVRRCRDRPAA